MVRKVLDHRDAGHLGAHFKTALDALEACKRGLNCVLADAVREGQRRSGGGIERVVLAGH